MTSTSTTDEARFGELRARLHEHPPDILEALELLEEFDEEEQRAGALRYLEQLLLRYLEDPERRADLTWREGIEWLTHLAKAYPAERPSTELHNRLWSALASGLEPPPPRVNTPLLLTYPGALPEPEPGHRESWYGEGLFLLEGRNTMTHVLIASDHPWLGRLEEGGFEVELTPAEIGHYSDEHCDGVLLYRDEEAHWRWVDLDEA